MNNKLTQFKRWILSGFFKSLSHEYENSRRLKSLFLTFFDGCYGIDAEPNTPSTFAMGVCQLEYKDNELIVHLRRPGLLIGKGGRTIDALAKQLDCKISIVEVNLQNGIETNNY